MKSPFHHLLQPLNNLSRIVVCHGINEFSIPQNIKIIGSFSFQYLDIEKISIPQRVTKICKYAFNYCSFLRKVEIPTNSNGFKRIQKS